MNVFQSLYTPGCLVRTKEGRHARVAVFDAHRNEVMLAYADRGMGGQVHVTELRAGNEDSEKAFGLAPCKAFFPKAYPAPEGTTGQARAVMHHRMLGTLIGGEET